MFFSYSPAVRATWPVFRISPSFVIFWLVGRLFLVFFFFFHSCQSVVLWVGFGSVLSCLMDDSPLRYSMSFRICLSFIRCPSHVFSQPGGPGWPRSSFLVFFWGKFMVLQMLIQNVNVCIIRNKCFNDANIQLFLIII